MSERTPFVTGEHVGSAEKWRALFLEYRLLVTRYWWVPASTAAIAIIVQLILLFLEPTAYASVARLLVSGKLSLPQDISYNEETVNFFGTQIELLKSPEVQKRAYETVNAHHPELTPSAVEITAFQVPKTSIFLLQGKGEEPRYVRAFLDAVMQAYVEARKTMFADKSQRALSVITDEIARQEEQLRKSESELFEWQRQNNLVSLREEDNSAGSYLALLNRRLASLETEHRLLRTLSVEQNLEREMPEVADVTRTPDLIDPQLPDDPSPSTSSAGEYLRARQQLILLQAQLAQSRELLKDSHPQIVEIKGQIALQKKLLEVLQQQAGEQIVARRDALQVQIDNTKAEIAEWQQRTIDLSQRMGQAERLKSKVDRQKELFNKLVANLQSVDIGSSIQQDVVSVMDPASEAQLVRPKYLALIAKSLVLGLAAGAGILFLIRGLDDRVNSLNRLNDLVTLDLAGVVPEIDPTSGWLTPQDARGSFREAFRNLRSWLKFQSSEEDSVRCLLVTSAIPGEGKSTVAANLASVLSWTDQRVLLVDADFRCGALHQSVSIAAEPGLAEVLLDEADVEKAIQAINPGHLYLLPRGEAFRHGMDAIKSGRMDSLFATLRKQFDWIIVDASPLLAVDDACNFAPLMDGALMVVRSRFSSYRLTKRALQLLESRHVHALGMVYNACSDTQDFPYYRYTEYYAPTTQA